MVRLKARIRFARSRTAVAERSPDWLILRASENTHAFLGEYFFGGLLVMFVFIFVARPITVLACLLPDRRGGWTGREIAFICWCRETGVIPAAVASLLLARGRGR